MGAPPIDDQAMTAFTVNEHGGIGEPSHWPLDMIHPRGLGATLIVRYTSRGGPRARLPASQ